MNEISSYLDTIHNVIVFLNIKDRNNLIKKVLTTGIQSSTCKILSKIIYLSNSLLFIPVAVSPYQEFFYLREPSYYFQIQSTEIILMNC